MSDVFRRVGRGGAGNYIPAKEIQEAESARQALDPESQDSVATTAPPVSSATSHPPQYIRTGRGGSGNYTEPPTTAEFQESQEFADRTKAALSASQAGKPRAGFSSRGGAGNWTEDAPAGDPEESTKQQEIADKVKNDINSSLPPPPKTYHQHDRDME